MSGKILQQILDEMQSIKKEVVAVKKEQQTTNERLTNIEMKQDTLYE